MKLALAFVLVLGSASSAMAAEAVGTWRSDPNDDGAWVDIQIAPCV